MRLQTMRQEKLTASERVQYTNTKAENETAMPRAANIKLCPFLSRLRETRWRAMRAAWLQPPGGGHRANVRRARSGSRPGTRVAAKTRSLRREVGGRLHPLLPGATPRE